MKLSEIRELAKKVDNSTDEEAASELSEATLKLCDALEFCLQDFADSDTECEYGMANDAIRNKLRKLGLELE